MADKPSDPLRGLTTIEQEVMGRLLQQSPERQKALPRPDTRQAESQRKRRQREKEAVNVAPDAS
jgi:hypothetical protein